MYFTLADIPLASQIHNEIAHKMSYLTYLGQPIPRPIGPHPMPMFEMHIPAANITQATTLLEELRGEFSVLIHPVQADELTAHTQDAIWLGEKLALNLDVLI